MAEGVSPQEYWMTVQSAVKMLGDSAVNPGSLEVAMAANGAVAVAQAQSALFRCRVTADIFDEKLRMLSVPPDAAEFHRWYFEGVRTRSRACRMMEESLSVLVAASPDQRKMHFYTGRTEYERSETYFQHAIEILQAEEQAAEIARSKQSRASKIAWTVVAVICGVFLVLIVLAAAGVGQ